MSLSYRDDEGNEIDIAGTPYDVLRDIMADHNTLVKYVFKTGVKNLLKSHYADLVAYNPNGTWGTPSISGDYYIRTYTESGVSFECTFHKNTHYIEQIVVNGTNSGTSIEFTLDNKNGNANYLENGKYIYNADTMIVNKMKDGTYVGSLPDHFEITDGVKAGKVYIYVQAGTTVINKVVKPMIYYDCGIDVPEYVRPALSNFDITEHFLSYDGTGAADPRHAITGYDSYIKTFYVAHKNTNYVTFTGDYMAIGGPVCMCMYQNHPTAKSMAGIMFGYPLGRPVYFQISGEYDINLCTINECYYL